MYPIADCHCDLLCYLENDSKRTAFDPVVRCAIPQLQAGHVKLQVMAVFAEPGSRSVQKGIAQVQIYQNLPTRYSQDFVFFNSQIDWKSSKAISTLLAFEGASTFCSENEPLQEGLKRLEGVINEVSKPLYISLTWNLENRFGGGAKTQIGLKDDGKRLLDFLNGRKIAVDFSHTSDLLAEEILIYIDQEQLDIPVMVSHSNARAITNVPRNLPDEIAREILRRQGIIGLNLYRFFIGSEPNEYLVKHLSHWVHLGGEKQIVFGADFFYGEDFSSIERGELFFKDYSNASCYGRLLDLFQKQLNFSQDQLNHLAHRNFLNFIHRLH